MKNKLFTGSTLAAVVVISTFFGQTTNAESAATLGAGFASCKVKKSNAVFL